VLILTQKGNPVAVLKSIEDDSHVKTRVCQYQALNNDKFDEIAKTFIVAKAEGYDKVLRKYGLKQIGFIKDEVNSIHSDDKITLRRKLNCYESKYSRKYFSQIFQMFDSEIRPSSRKTFLAYDGLNNTFNLAYEILRWKVHIALLNAKLEPYLGFLHSLQYGKPSLACDFQELYRYLIDDFIISYCKDISKRDFEYKTEKRANRKAKRQYLNNELANEFTNLLNNYFLSKVNIPRMKVGNKQEIETLISEEALLFAKYLRGEIKAWNPRIVNL
jgi:CRISPR-associated endonuclease Cas1